MELTPLGPGFGAEVKGANLIDVASSDVVYRRVRAAFDEHSLLLFRGIYYVAPFIGAMALLGGVEATRRWRSIREAMTAPSDE